MIKIEETVTTQKEQIEILVKDNDRLRQINREYSDELLIIRNHLLLWTDLIDNFMNFHGDTNG